MTAVVAMQVLVIAGFWPFGGDARSARQDAAESIGSLQSRPVIIAPAEMPVVTSRDALEQYRQFLDLPDADAALARDALRRVGDLSLAVGEAEQIEAAEPGLSQALQLEAIGIYQQWLQQHADAEHADRVLYQLARAYDSTGQPDAALATLNRLVTQRPDSELVSEAWFRAGELHFSAQDFNAASDAYAAVLAGGSGGAYFQQSLYKFGWSRFRLGEYDDSTTAFLDLLQLRLRAAAVAAPPHASESVLLERMSRPERELVDDTLRVLALTFAFLDGADSIAAALQTRGDGDSSWLLYRSLANLYREQERFIDAAVTLQAFVTREPLHAESPAMLSQRIDTYTDGGFGEQVLEAKQDFVITYGLDQPYWSVYSPGERADVVTALKQHLGDLATHDHALAQQSSTATDYQRAAGWYRHFLDWFPDDPDSAQHSFLLAELLVESGDPIEATRYFDRAAWQYPGFERAAEAAYAGVLSAQAALSTLDRSQQSDWQSAQQHRVLRFARDFPAHPEATAVLIDAAESRFAGGEMAAAVRIAGAVLDQAHQPTAAQQRVAWTVVGHGQFELGNYARAEQAYERLRSLGGGPALAGAALDERLAASVYRQAEQAADRADSDAAVGHFLRVASAAPASAIGANALYDAAALLLSEQRHDEAIRVLTQFRSSYPQHALVDDATLQLALAYERTGQWLTAATEYERLSALASQPADVRRAALWSAAGFYQQAGDLSRARAAWARFVADWPDDPAQRIEVEQRLADLAQDAGDPVERKRWLERVLASDAAAGAERSDRSRTLAARAALELATEPRDAFAAVYLQAPLARSLERKRALMEQALKAYDRAASYNVAEVTTAATYHIADLYFRLGADLMASERPAGLDADELEQYEILLEEQAFPFEEKAIELFELNAGRARAGVYDEWVALSYQQLALLLPVRYAKTEKVESHVSAIY